MGAFAYATLMEWTDLVVSNAEFQLYPVKRYAMGRLAQWTGFALGVVVAFFAFRAGDVAIEGLGELSCVIAIIVVAAFSLYGADDSETEDALLSLMTASAECPPSIDPPKNASPFRDRCRAIAEQYDALALTPDQGTVFICHGDCMDDAQRLAGMIREKHGVEVKLITYTGTVIGAHSGPGTLALFFLGKHR